MQGVNGMAHVYRKQKSDAGSETDEFALSLQQLMSVMDPLAPIRAVISTKQELARGRPYRVWRNDPEVTRIINDRLAAAMD